MEPERTPANFNRVVVQTEQEPQTAGELIRFWRTRRGLSQLELSLDANVSTKHLSFVETGRSSPSRQLLVHLAQHLDLPIAERNRLLLAGGFAPPYLELPYDGEVMQPLRESLERLLEAHEPNPTLIVDGLWNLIESNRAASLLWDGVDPELLEAPINMLRLGVHPGGLPRISSMTAACNAPLIHRLKRRSREDADPALAELIEEVEAGRVSGTNAKAVLARVFGTGESPREVIAREGLGQVSDAASIASVVSDVLAAHPAQVADYRAGKQPAIKFLVGQVMKQTRGRADPNLVADLLTQEMTQELNA